MTSSPEGLSIFSAALEAPRATALVLDGRELTFDELAAQTAPVTDGLRHRFGDGVHAVAAVAERRLETLLLAYAVMELGWTLIPLHPRSRDGERQRFVESLGLSSWMHPGELPRARDAWGGGANAASDVEATLAVVPTSGSTGRPKGVALSYRAFLAAAAASAGRLGWGPNARWLLSLPLAHVGGLSILTRCLIDRRTAVVPPEGESFDPETVLKRIHGDAVTHLSVVPYMLRRLLDVGGPPPPSLRCVLVGGAALPPAWLEDARRAGWPALATYGLTEACSQVATQPPEDLETFPPTAGAPLLDGVEARLDGDGVLSLRGPSLFSGYRPDADGPRPPEAWLRTGDVARIEDGRLHILGRHDHVIVTGGENVHPAEVERALLQVAGVGEACVVGVPDARWGHTVAAAVAPGDDPHGAPALAIDAIDDELRERIAGFKRPRRWRLLDALPRTPSGKVDRRKVARLFDGSTPAHSAHHSP
ncbi:MAG: AMP-binding protein [Acidobacteriota bacterium]